MWRCRTVRLYTLVHAHTKISCRNQKEFSLNVHKALRDLCQGGLIGDAEMMLFYAFREPQTGDLLAGTYVFYFTLLYPN